MLDPETRRPSRKLSITRWSDDPVVRYWLEDLWRSGPSQKLVKDPRGKTPKASDEDLFKVLVLDLYYAWFEDPHLELGLSRTTNHYKVKSRYNPLGISHRITQVADALEEVGWIRSRTGSEIAQKVTRVWPTDELISRFQRAPFDWNALTYPPTMSLVILNRTMPSGSDTKEVEYNDLEHPVIAFSQSLLKDYNALLFSNHIDLGSAPQPYWESQEAGRRVSLAPGNKLVRRIFYRGSWELGGRYHGGWWQQLPSAVRRDIMINEFPTVEVDFSGFHVALAYALEGLEPARHPYSLRTTLPEFSKEKQQADLKLLVLTALNAASKREAYAAFRGERNSVQSDSSPNYTDDLLNRMLGAFLEEHPAIEKYLCSDCGVELMALDARITTRIIERFVASKKVILTIHDSYIVEANEDEWLQRVMKEACEREIGEAAFSLRQDGVSPRLLVHWQRQDPLFDYATYRSSIGPKVICDGFRGRLEAFEHYRSRVATTSPAAGGPSLYPPAPPLPIRNK